MKTTEIKPGQTYQGAFRHKDRLFEVVEVSDRATRRKQAREEGVNTYNLDYAAQQTIKVRELGWKFRSTGVHLHQPGEKEDYWVRPQDISHEVDIEALANAADEANRRKAAAKRQVEKDRPEADARVRRVNAHLKERNITNVEFYVTTRDDHTRIVFGTYGDFTIDNIEALLGL